MSDESPEILSLSKQYWLNNEIKFDENVVLNIYNAQIISHGFSHKQIQALEFTQYFEKYLWPNFQLDKFKCEREYIISICAIINEKLAEKVVPWETFTAKPEEFGGLFQKVLEMIIETHQLSKRQWLEKVILIQFLSNCFLSMTEVDLIFNEIKYIMSLGMWTCLSSQRLSAELSKNKDYKHKYGKLIKSDSRTDTKIKFKRIFVPKLLDHFLSIIESNAAESIILRFAENCLMLFINLESVLVSRRYINALIDDKHIIVRAQKCSLTQQHLEDSNLFHQLVEMLDMYAHFEIDESTGSTLTDIQLENRHRTKLVELQRMAFRRFKEPMRELWLSKCGQLENGDNLHKILSEQSEEDLRWLATSLGLVNDEQTHEKEDLVEMFCYSYKRRCSTLRRLNNLPLYPTEKLIYDENKIPDGGYYNSEDIFAIPRLSLQYLSFHDYLMRNFELFRLEASYEIKQDVEQCLSMMRPIIDDEGSRTDKGNVMFEGWSRMALAIDNFEIVEIAKPAIGRQYPRAVKADVTVILGSKDTVRREWEGLARHDPCFLLTVVPKLRHGERYNNKQPMASQLGQLVIRGCEVEGLLDAEGKLMSEEDRRNHTTVLPGLSRTWRVLLDPCQYHDDVIDDNSETKDIYGSFNIFMRRKPKENNFKAVLETIRDLMNEHCVVPDWLSNLLLGYEQPTSAHYSSMCSSYIARQDWSDTFLDLDHVRESFPQYTVVTKGDCLTPPFRLTFPAPLDDTTLKPITMHEQLAINNHCDDQSKPVLIVEPQKRKQRLPQRFVDPRRWTEFETLSSEPVGLPPSNPVRFTATQTEAIRSGMQPGLTMVIGPPGTGKTDVAVQIVANLYRNYPGQRTLLVTHSNQALNQLFEKIMGLGEIEERHLLRLGHGEEALETTADFSKHGRVNAVLARRLTLLGEVARLAGCLGLPEGPVYTCETAQHLLLAEVVPRWLAYLESSSESAAVFPFTDFFVPRAHQTVEALAALPPPNALFQHLLDIFLELDDARSFELLRSGAARANSLLLRHAKVVAMTCTHAALRRRDLVELGFRYDNIVIEEAAQILEIETFLPLLLQKPDRSGLSRLKRWVMIGDHHQLPPVVKQPVLAGYGGLAHSMFARLVRLGVPAVQLDAQGRARPALRALYGWRYHALADLPAVSAPRRPANPGLLAVCQLVDVPAFLGRGETEPTPHFLQNLAEAEYAVALYMYLRALGYPAASVAILTTYNGQKHLLRDVVAQRCGAVGAPSVVTTVDRFQGRQADYVILSLVRTKAVGHLRDVRRLVVALSRARLGLYVFARTDLFLQCRELRAAFELLRGNHGTDLALVAGETFGECARTEDDVPPPSAVTRMADVRHMAQYVHELMRHRAAFEGRSLKEVARDDEAVARDEMVVDVNEEAVAMDTEAVAKDDMAVDADVENAVTVEDAVARDDNSVSVDNGIVTIGDVAVSIEKETVTIIDEVVALETETIVRDDETVVHMENEAITNGDKAGTLEKETVTISDEVVALDTEETVAMKRSYDEDVEGPPTKIAKIEQDL